MKRIALFVSLGAVLVLSVPSAAQKIKVSTLSVPVYVTVLDESKRLVPDLQQDDFEVLDNGKPQQISVFENTPTPITVTVMLDTSGSMTTSLDLVKDGAEQFLLRLLPVDQAQVGAFNDKIEFHPDSSFSSNRDQLVRSLKDLDFGYPTRLWDAVDESISHLENADGRKVVLVFTDGDDTASKMGLGKVMDRARAKDVMVYAIGLVNEYFNGQQRVRSQPDKGLKHLAEDTGGGYFELKRTADLNETFTRVAEELHSQYVLGFSPEALDDKIHKLDVRVKKSGMTARARKSYLATKTSGS
ncbi:MAG TPA: VWA domain-containing protein [Vicinamibacterales bacterium]|jgi:Ca-activated chloride channel family protein|nr:VWA domain-containing protein [Vicinamibacterales bacterium]